MAEESRARAFGARFEDVARRLPHKAAIVEDGHAIDYATLESTSRAIAARIEAAAAGRSGFAALLFSRKTTTVQAMVASLRCGRAYVPLDGGDPDERLGFVLHDGAPAILLTDRTLAARARSLAGATCAVVEIDGDERPDPAFTLPEVAPDSLAYVLYTSGSTGSPKGVTQTQRGVMFFADAFVRRLSLGEADRLSLLWTMSFAAANMHVYGGLLNGATVCAYDLRRDGIDGLAQWLDRERITAIHAFPTVLRGLCATLPPGANLRHVRVIDIGAEATYTSDVALFVAHTRDDAILVNQLGASEADCIAQHVVSHGDPLPKDAILPLGRTTPGVDVRIRRDDGSDAAVDEAGAIVVCSAHVSPGYWNRPDLDAQFLPPDPRHPGRRCYVSGDRGRIDAEGRLHFLGRTGSRVKIRGLSVDLAEVDAALAALPGVVRCAALAPAAEEGKEAERIVACLTVAAAVEPAELRRQLAQRLPSYMLPSAFVFMDAFPTTSTGKVDRLALARNLPASLPLERSPAVPADELELAVAGMFERLLKVSPIGPRDDFFLLGGDSMLVVELQNRLRDAFGTDVPDFHRHSTVAFVAAAIRRHRSAAPTSGARLPLLVPLRETGSRPPLFLVHGRLGQALVSPHFLAMLGDDQPVWIFRARGLDGREPHESIEAMAADYADEIRRVRQHGPYFIGALCIGAFVAIEIARLLRAAGETVLPLLLLDPPERAFTVHEANATDSAILSRLREREAEVGSTATLDDPACASASIRVARAFEDAIGRYRTRPYDGPVCMLVSSDRLAAAPRTQWRRVYTGEVRQFVVSEKHQQVLDAKSPRFAVALERAMRRILVGLPVERQGSTA